MGIFRKSRKKPKKGTTPVTDQNGLPDFSPNPITNLILTDIALRGVSRFARQMAEKKMLSKRYSREDARKAIDNRSISETLMAAGLARVATRSVPGAVVIGGGLLAKALYDRSRSRKARAEGQKALHKRMSDSGNG